MAGSRRKRRRLALAVLAGIALGSFAFGAALGDAPAPRPSLAETLPAPRLAGERIVTGFEGTTVPRGLRRALAAGEVAGVILFADNLPDRPTARRLIAELGAIEAPRGLRSSLLVMVDQEGGLVKRLDGPPAVSAAAMGARGPRFSAAQGARTAASLRALGINVDLAPVLDLGRRGGVIAATERSFGADPEQVEETAIPFAEALQAGGVAATGKHFPGFGAAPENTDYAAQRIDLPRGVLRRLDEAPFAAFARAGGELVMLSTAVYPAFSPRPAAFSRALATTELRGRLGFTGVSITDALESAAVRHFGGARKAGLAAAAAGTDLLLFTDFGEARRAWRALVAGLRAGRLDRAGFEESAARVLALRSRLGR